jgi:aryl-alcohol dehydrogenase-like predicted oxidoreductase
LNLSNKQAHTEAMLPIHGRIGLGTVQFGIDYGITNSVGKVSKTEVNKIATAASKIGITVFDTACEYGNSEAVLGQALPRDKGFKIITKTPVSEYPEINPDYCEKVESRFETSLNQLGIDQCYGLLVHHAADILKPGGDQLVQTLRTLQNDGKTEKIGVSIYNAEEIDSILKIFQPDLVQVPINILDQRLLKSGKLQKLKNLGVEIHARSLFLQGTLLIDSSELPAFFSPVLHQFQKVENLAASRGLSQLELCLLFGLSIDEIDLLVIGITSLKELLDLQTSYSNLPNHMLENVAHLSIDEEQYINPALWPSK